MTRLEQILVKMGFDVSESSKVNEAMGKVKSATKGGEEGLAGFNTHGREMHELIHKIGAQSPILGSALKACFSPESIGIIALVAGLEWVTEKFNKFREKAQELSQTLTNMWVNEQKCHARHPKAGQRIPKKLGGDAQPRNRPDQKGNRGAERSTGRYKGNLHRP